jgi:hypothetical protein
MKSTLIALAVSLFGAASASGCQPNFQGVAMAILSSGSKWGLGSGPISAGSPILSLPEDRVPDFRFEFSGRPTGSYIARYAPFECPFFPKRTDSHRLPTSFQSHQLPGSEPSCDRQRLLNARPLCRERLQHVSPFSRSAHTNLTPFPPPAKSIGSWSALSAARTHPPPPGSLPRVVVLNRRTRRQGPAYSFHRHRERHLS